MNTPLFLVVGSNKEDTFVEKALSLNEIPYIKESLSYPLYHIHKLHFLEKLYNSSFFDAIIITSTHTLNSLHNSTLLKLNSFVETPLFLSGLETQKSAKLMGFKNTISFSEWGLKRLEFELIKLNHCKNILYLHGDPYTKLSHEFITKKNVVNINLYSMIFKSQLSTLTIKHLQMDEIQYIVFLSNATQEIFHQKLQRYQNYFKYVTAISLSKKVKDNILNKSLYKEVIICDTFDKIELYCSEIAKCLS